MSIHAQMCKLLYILDPLETWVPLNTCILPGSVDTQFYRDDDTICLNDLPMDLSLPNV